MTGVGIAHQGPGAYNNLARPPFVAWLAAHGLLGTGRPWELHHLHASGGPVYRRSTHAGVCDLVVRPKRNALEAMR